MAIEVMKKVHLVGHQHIESRVIQLLQHLGVVQIVNIRKGTEQDRDFAGGEGKELEERLSQIERILNFLSQYEKTGFLQGLLESFLPAKTHFSKEKARHILRAFSEVESFKKYKALEDRIDSIKLKREQLREERNQLGPYSQFPFSKKDLISGENTDLIWGMISKKIFLKNTSILDKKFKKVWYGIFKNDAKNLFLAVTCFKEEKEDINQVLKNLNFQFGAFSKAQTGTFKERLKDLGEEEKVLKLEEEEVNKGALNLFGDKSSLLLLHDNISNRLSREYISRNFSQTRAAFILEGWIKASEVKILENKVVKVFPELEIAVSSPPSQVQPPVALKNRSWIKPFEFITRLYGMPNYYEFDPTPFLMPFFALFFGLCITDAGYGLILLLLGLLVLKRVKLEPEQKLVFRVFILCGILIVLLGILLGSIFCLDFDHLPRMLVFLQGFRRFMIFDPLKNIMLFLGLCLGLGVIQIYFGILLKVILQLKRKRIAEALFQELPWIFLLTGLILLLGGYLGGLPDAILPLAKVFSLGGAGALFLSAGWGTKNIFLRLGKGLFKLYGTVGILGDILSYSRLLALGLATTVIGMAVNIIGDLFSKVPFIGVLLGLVIVVLGHGFNLFINSLSGFAHTLRLQFVEFFTKFYENGGELFQPFQLSSKFTKVA